MAETIDTERLHRWLTAGRPVIVVDTLPASVFEKGHLPRAINIVSDEIRGRAPGLLPDRASRIVVCCGGPRCKRAGRAAARLESLGYVDVWHYREGRKGWIAAGHALHREPASPPGGDHAFGC